MGVEGMPPPPMSVAVAAACAGDKTALSTIRSAGELLRSSVVAVDCDADEDETDQEQDEQEDETEDDHDLVRERRRRTSIPPTFVYGAETSDKVTGEERRWRSFDCGASATKAASIELLLDSRIEQESEQASKCRAKLGRRRRFEWVRSVKCMFSSSKKEQVQLLQMQLVAEVAKSNRSLELLNDRKTLISMNSDDGSNEEGGSETAVESSRESRSSFISVVDTQNQTLLDGIESADQVLAEDNVHHILSCQARWFQELIGMHADKKFQVTKKHGVAPSVVMQHFLNEFVRPDGVQRVPCAFDVPTAALVRFEKIVSKYKFMKPALKKALDEVCNDVLASFTHSGNQLSSGKANVFANREARDVMQSLVREIVDAITEEAWVATGFRSILRAFVEQMVFSRLACACYRSSSPELDELNATWREQATKARSLGLHEVGLPFKVATGEAGLDGELSGVIGLNGSALFSKSIQAFNAIPHLVPSCVLAAFLNAVRVLYRETNQALGVPSACISADVLLPLMVFVLSRCELPHLHSQMYLMEEFAIEESQEGSEAAYYLACLQAAVGYIMTRDDAACALVQSL